MPATGALFAVVVALVLKRRDRAAELPAPLAGRWLLSCIYKGVEVHACAHAPRGWRERESAFRSRIHLPREIVIAAICASSAIVVSAFLESAAGTKNTNHMVVSSQNRFQDVGRWR